MTKLITCIMLFIIVAAKAVFANEPDFSVADQVFICNGKSDITHLRKGPSAQNYPITGHLPNGLSVSIQSLKVNEAGYLYYSGEPTSFATFGFNRCTQIERY